MMLYYNTLLGVQNATSPIVLGCCNETLYQQCLSVTGLRNTSFPLKYLGVPITASRLTKVECTSLVEKIMAKATKNISFAERARLINSVIFGMYTYWASIFLLPTEVTDKIIGICRNHLWSGVGEYKKAPYISWHQTCLPKSQGGIGIKDLSTWNKATIAKLTWAVAKKKEIL
ncbi:hypothetical protein Cgig2_023793 [Carnegiea gigantea]|uniref:Reverse transcriptase n=1 Tax=Carnegiea gigantea TaxID=171969 RepID=A0A9Q1JRJ9_9CARY|nr:hypothetical protein Cgig2_023793 [Carnegiea gigantea]